ncbi:hypothetical protein LMG26685_01825 [Achromobacter mucicolens]|uniref:hypothetical protein n=1 Tax=Achromobacter mucicolens TaxID=1389922 RepID=UPI0009D52B34|nr:hypothetical protein [Achromobacter mucicolens]OXC89531.1 hypothetical protein BMR85_018120 [Achromobacter sp. KAs 3-5]CAB3638886.1 hypothetical protein LMG26685_01825 [Achromobacter mucicolens]
MTLLMYEAHKALSKLRAHVADERAALSQYDYQALFDAIGKAVKVHPNLAIEISVQAFRAALASAPVPDVPQDTGIPEADRLIGRLMSSDPDFDDCARPRRGSSETWQAPLWPAKRSERLCCSARHGWASSWKDAQLAWIRTLDEGVTEPTLTEHALYFSLQDVRPAAITTKIQNRDHDAYDFAAHANPATTHKHYDRRLVKKASATE